LCNRLGLESLAYLWYRNQKELLLDMISDGMDSVIIKTCTMGLTKEHLLKSIKEMQPLLFEFEDKYQINVCGEGGEFETLTLDCPLYKKRIVITDYEVVTHSTDIYVPVYYVVIKAFELVDK